MFTPTRATALAAAGTLLAAGGALAATPAAASSPTGAQVVNARIAGHPTYDRIVIDVKGALPKATVQRVDRLRYDGSGKAVPLAGKSFLRITLTPAVAHNAAGTAVYRGPRLTTLRLTRVKGLALTGDFEGYVSFGVALDKKTGWTVTRLGSPSRLVVDIKR
ncbi:AMIN-like domain-containing (lipo)protein [Peterkaempfera bronchialis]|uniref:AMIN-like domain-containing protein n=1 Tax=Peterkaempfera bronchialis TaxID=2126346 RepID=A0A345ST89_9ACTN|nr:hypothetical protein [Peterkaempfera bronchialis]AXI76944.1 hypothetical protein C7M71_005225 [Peterkaempfera bronchialis]